MKHSELYATHEELMCIADQLWYKQYNIYPSIGLVLFYDHNNGPNVTLFYSEVYSYIANMYWEAFEEILNDYLSNSDEYYYAVVPTTDMLYF